MRLPFKSTEEIAKNIIDTYTKLPIDGEQWNLLIKAWYERTGNNITYLEIDRIKKKYNLPWTLVIFINTYWELLSLIHTIITFELTPFSVIQIRLGKNNPGGEVALRLSVAKCSVGTVDTLDYSYL